MKKTFFIIAITVISIGFLYSQGFFNAFSSLDAVQETVQGYGAWGPLIYIVAFALGEPVGLTGIVLTISAALIWPWYLAFAFSWVASMGASAFGFWLSRNIGRDFVEKRLPARFNKYNDRLKKNPLKTVIIIRLVLFLFPGAHFFFGVSKVPFAPFMLGSIIGLFPGIFLFSYFAGKFAR